MARRATFTPPSHFQEGPDAEPGDERNGDCSREQLIRMNARFVERMQAAIERGLERRPEETTERAA